MGPLRWVQHPEFRAVLFRRTFEELERSLVDRSRERYLAFGARYNDNKRVWVFPSGARVRFCHLQHAKDVAGHQSAEYHYVGFDELTHFEFSQYRYMLSRARRRTGSPIPIRIRAGTNPDVNWVRDRWAPWVRRGPDYEGIRAKSGEVLWFVTNEDGTEQYVPKGTPEALSRTFIRAGHKDNPQIDSAYITQLKAMDAVQRARLLDGDWDAVPAAGAYFRRHWCELVDAVPADARRVRYWDRAGTKDPKGDPDWTVGVLMAQTADGLYFIEDVIRFRGTPHEVDQAILNAAIADGKSVEVGIEQDPGQAGKHQALQTIRMLAGYRVHRLLPTGDKVTRFGPFSSQAEAGNVKVKRAPWNLAYFTELEGLPDWKFDDQADGTSGAFARLSMFATSQMHRAQPETPQGFRAARAV